jgi:subtilisin family serine protease/N-acetylneuraminic acid mutarotase
MKSRVVLAAAAILAAACQEPTAPPDQSATPIPDLASAGSKADRIPNQYIVVLRKGGEDARSLAGAVAARHGGQLKVKRVYRAALRGMAVEIPDSLAAALRQDPSVEYIEPNQVVRAWETVVQPGATYGIDRVDQRNLPLSGTYSYASDGEGVRVYIIDTGINFGHSEFGGRALPGTDAIFPGNGGADCNGHGTHVAGTVGGTTYGVAKKVRLYSVRVLNCSGSGDVFSVVDGIDWVTANRVLPAIANMSLGANGFSPTINEAVENSIRSGVTYVVAAGNSHDDACIYSPSSVFPAIVVGASDRTDQYAYFSNIGSCVDLAAPGVNITSAWIGSTDATTTISGTSMATPHTAGAAALYLSLKPGAPPGDVATALQTNATSGVLTSVPTGTQNRLLYTGFIAPAGWQPEAPLPAGRRDLTLGVYGGQLYAIGGVTATGPTRGAMVYNPSGGVGWASLSPLPAARHAGNGAAELGTLLYVPGGYNGANVLTRTLYAYRPGTNAWSTRAAMPVTSGCGASHAIGGKLFVFSGCTGASAATSGLLHRYDPSTNTWVSRRAAPRAHRFPATGVINGKLYVAGGSNASGSVTATLDVYDPATNTWAARAAMPGARWRSAGAVLGGLLYVIGGRNPGGSYLSTVAAYNPATNTWQTRPNLSAPRASLGAAELFSVVHAVGGRNASNVVALAEAYKP